MVCPFSAGSKWIVSPSLAAVMAARSEPAPLSAVLVTTSVAASTLPAPAIAAQSKAEEQATRQLPDRGEAKEEGN